MLYGEFKKQFNGEEEENQTYIIEDTRCRVDNSNKVPQKQKSKKPNKILKVFFTLLLLGIVVFCAVLLYYDLFDENGINGLFGSAIKSTDFIYFLSAGSFDKIEEATALSDNLKPKGCAGYIYYDGSFNVLVSFYLDENTASEVSQKTKYTIIKIYKNSELKKIPSTIKGQYDKCKNFENDVLSELFNASVSLQNEKDFAKCAKTISNLIDSQKINTQEFLATAPKTNNIDSNKFASKINSSINQLEKLKNDPTLSNLRFTAIYIALIMA